MFEPGWILIGFIEPGIIFYGPNFPIFCVQTTKTNFHYRYVWAGLNPDWFPAQTHSHFLWDAKLPYNHCSNKNSSPSQTSMAATNMFEPGWILIGFIEDRLGDPKQFNPARLNPFPFSMGRQTSLYSCSDNKFFSISNFHGGYKYVWAGLNPDWFHWGSSRGPKQLIQPGSDPFPFSMGRQTSLFSCSDNKFFSISNFHGGYKYVWAGLNPDWFHWGSSRGPKTIWSSPAQPIPIFYGTPNFPIIIVQTLNSSPSQTSMAATNMFEPGWILIGFIEDRLGDPKQFNPARLKPIPIFYGTPNFPIFL